MGECDELELSLCKIGGLQEDIQPSHSLSRMVTQQLCIHKGSRKVKCEWGTCSAAYLQGSLSGSSECQKNSRNELQRTPLATSLKSSVSLFSAYRAAQKVHDYFSYFFLTFFLYNHFLFFILHRDTELAMPTGNHQSGKNPDTRVTLRSQPL